MNEYDKLYKYYRASTTVYSKPLLYGGRNFVKYNSITKQYYQGNTASTAVSDHNSGMLINGVTTKELKDVMRQLKSLGYSEYRNDWSKGQDTYKNIQKAGL